jgi:hypothetical protein
VTENTNAKTPDTGGAATTTKTETSGGPPWIPIIGLGALAAGVGVFLLTRDTKADPDSAIDGILAGLQGMSGDPDIKPTAHDCYEAWQRAVADYFDNRSALLQKYATTLMGYTQQFNTAMTQLDTFKTNYGVLLSESSEMQAALQRWTEVQSVDKKADLVVAAATLTVGAGSLAIKGGKWVVTKMTAEGVELSAEAIAAQRTAAGLAAGAGKLEQAMNAAANIEKALAAAPMTNPMQPSAVVISALAKEAGRDLVAVIAENGGSIEAATEKLFWEVFAKRGYHFLPNAGAMAAKFEKPTYMMGQLIKSIPPELIAEGFGDASQVLPRLVANVRIALAKAASSGGSAAAALDGSFQAASDISQLMQWAGADSANFWRLLEGAVAPTEVAIADAQVLAAERNVATLQKLIKAGQDLEHNEPLLQEAIQGLRDAWAAAPKAQYVEKLFTPEDIALLKKIVEAGGDMDKLAQLAPALQASSPALQALSGQVPAMGMALQGGGSLITPVPGVMPIQTIDVLAFNQSIGINDNAGYALLGTAWGMFAHPFTTAGQLRAGLEMTAATEEFLERNSATLLEQADALQRARDALQNMAKGIENSRFAGDLEAALAKIGADLDAMERVVSNCPELSQSIRDEVRGYRAGYQEMCNTLRNVSTFLTEAAAMANRLAAQLDQAIQQRTATTLVDPSTATLVEAARTLLLAEMSVTRAAALAGSDKAPAPSFGMPPSVQAELKAFEQKK